MPPFSRDALLPFVARHRHAARRHDLAGVVFARRGDGDELRGREARIEERGEAVRDGRWQRDRRERRRIAWRLWLAARRGAAGRWRGQWPVAADRLTRRVLERRANRGARLGFAQTVQRGPRDELRLGFLRARCPRRGTGTRRRTARRCAGLRPRRGRGNRACAAAASGRSPTERYRLMPRPPACSTSHRGTASPPRRSPVQASGGRACAARAPAGRWRGRDRGGGRACRATRPPGLCR